MQVNPGHCEKQTFRDYKALSCGLEENAETGMDGT